MWTIKSLSKSRVLPIIVLGLTLIETRRDIAMLLDGQNQVDPISTSLIDTFMVPYEENVHFTGREKLLATLCTMLCETSSKQWDHRVALYGLGGVGKTQLALRYGLPQSLL